MTKRVKPNALVITTLDQADEVLRRLAEIDREQRKLESDANAMIDQIKSLAKADLEPLSDERKRLETDLAVFANLKKAELFGEVRNRSVELTFGVMGFRRATSLRLLAKRTWGGVLEKLEAYGFTTAIRVKQEVDKSAMSDWSDEKLAQVGVRRETSDDFFVELKQEDLPTQSA